jgi:hypothetical protein
VLITFSIKQFFSFAFLQEFGNVETPIYTRLRHFFATVYGRWVVLGLHSCWWSNFLCKVLRMINTIPSQLSCGKSSCFLLMIHFCMSWANSMSNGKDMLVFSLQDEGETKFSTCCCFVTIMPLWWLVQFFSSLKI